MRFVDIQKMALFALGKNKIQTALTMLGIVIGVSAVIAMVSLGQGAQKLIEQQVASMGTNVLQVQGGGNWQGGGARGAADQSQALTESDVDAIRREIPTVGMATPIVQAQGQFVYGNQNWSSRIEGSNETYLEIRGWKIGDGEFIDESDVRSAARVVVLGKTIADNLFSGGGEPVGQTIRIRNLPYRVIGVLASKGQSANGQDQDDTAIMPYTTIQKKMLGAQLPRIQRITVSAVNADATGAAKEQIEVLLRERHQIREGQQDDFRVNNITEIAETAQQTTRVMTLLLGSIAAVSLVVGGIGIMNIMLVSVTERTREIGIRMAIGSRGSYIRLQFLAESVMLCMVGGLVGVLLGIGLSMGIASVMGWPSFVSPEAATIAFLFSAVTGIFFGYYPAHKAASLDPIEALRYE